MTDLPAEGALFRPGLIAYLLDRADGRAGRPAVFGYDLVRAAYAPVADVHVQPAADDRFDLLSPRSAERARHKVSSFGHAPHSIRTVPRIVRDDSGQFDSTPCTATMRMRAPLPRSFFAA